MAPWSDDFTVSDFFFFFFVFILEILEIHACVSSIQEVIFGFHLTFITTLRTATFNLMSSECAH